MPDEGDEELVLIADYWFRAERDNDLVYLNPLDPVITSCAGMGEDLEAAKRDVKISASVLLEDLGAEQLTDEFVNFALDVYTDKTNSDGQCMCSECRSDRGELDV